MPVYRFLKLAGAILLLVSLALPMSSCVRYVDAKGNRVEVEKDAPLPEGVRKEVLYDYALDNFDAQDAGSWSVLLAFAWPALLVGLLFWRKRGRAVLALRIAEPLLLAGSFYLISFIASFLVDRMEAGAYLAFFALGIYALGAVWEDVVAFRQWRQERRASPEPVPGTSARSSSQG